MLESVSAVEPWSQRLATGLMAGIAVASVAALVVFPLLLAIDLALGNRIPDMLVALLGAGVCAALVLCCLGLSLRRRSRIEASAGAHWLAVGPVGAARTPRNSVPLYALDAVSLLHTATRPMLGLGAAWPAGVPYPESRDPDAGPPQRHVEVPCALLETNPQLWALVHHGLRHSVAHGAQTDQDTCVELRLTPLN